MARSGKFGRQMLPRDNPSMIANEDLPLLELQHPGAAAAAVYDRPIGLRVLHVDPQTGEEHYLIRYPAGVKGRMHSHSAAHTIIVLEGRLDANGRIFGPGSYVHFAAGEPMKHQATAAETCLFVLLFHGSFDVSIIDG
jgi:quercetin dioxygenase-like cupin family protein